VIKNKRISLIAVSGSSLLAALLFIAPFYFLIVNSFKPLGELVHNPAALPQSLFLDNFPLAWNRLDYPRIFFNSLLITVMANAGICIVAAMAAFRISRFPTRFNGMLYGMFLAGMIVPFQSIMIPLTLVLRDLNLVNSYTGIIMSYIGLGMGFGVFMYTGFMRSMPKEILEAAVIDGCSQMGMFWRIAFPLMKNATFSLLIMHTFWTWNDFLLPLVILPKQELKTLPVAVSTLLGHNVLQWDLALPALLMSIIPTALIFLSFQKSITAGITEGGVKG
jgi:raffinose/stachyose/melibiose transport system permease protein